MTVYIKHIDEATDLILYILSIITIVLSVLIPVVIVKIIGLVLLIILFAILVVPPSFLTVTVDEEALRYKEKSIQLSSIYYISCEPYKRRIRKFENRIRLTIITDDGVTHQLNDFLDAQTLAKDLLNNTNRAVPLINLYEFLKEKINYFPEGEVSE